MATPHNSAEKGDIAKIVLMPGDPLRAKFIAEQYLDHAKEFNHVRNMLGYTGEYKGMQISVMGHGMGMPSIGLYSYELYHEYDVDAIIRIGSAGGLADDVKVRDLILAIGASTDSSYANQWELPGTFSATADYELLSLAAQAAKNLQIPVKVGNVISSDTFYNERAGANDAWKKMGVLAVEMEAAALYMNAARAGKQALSMLTVSDHIYTGESLPAKERETTFTQMIQTALDTALLWKAKQ